MSNGTNVHSVYLKVDVHYPLLYRVCDRSAGLYIQVATSEGLVTHSSFIRCLFRQYEVQC
jgi:hypothetical protein